MTPLEKNLNRKVNGMPSLMRKYKNMTVMKESNTQKAMCTNCGHEYLYHAKNSYPYLERSCFFKKCPCEYFEKHKTVRLKKVY